MWSTLACIAAKHGPNAMAAHNEMLQKGHVTALRIQSWQVDAPAMWRVQVDFDAHTGHSIGLRGVATSLHLKTAKQDAARVALKSLLTHEHEMQRSFLGLCLGRPTQGQPAQGTSRRRRLELKAAEIHTQSLQDLGRCLLASDNVLILCLDIEGDAGTAAWLEVGVAAWHTGDVRPRVRHLLAGFPPNESLHPTPERFYHGTSEHVSSTSDLAAAIKLEIAGILEASEYRLVTHFDQRKRKLLEEAGVDIGILNTIDTSMVDLAASHPPQTRHLEAIAQELGLGSPQLLRNAGNRAAVVFDVVQAQLRRCRHELAGGGGAGSEEP